MFRTTARSTVCCTSDDVMICAQYGENAHSCSYCGVQLPVVRIHSEVLTKNTESQARSLLHHGSDVIPNRSRNRCVDVSNVDGASHTRMNWSSFTPTNVAFTT